MASVDWLHFFKEEIKNDSQRIRLQAVSRAHQIAYAIGTRRTVDELIPFLYESSKKQDYFNDDEFLFRTGEQYILLLDFVGGNHLCLLEAVQWLALQEETVIREKAIEGIKEICIRGRVNVQQDVLPTLVKLSQAEWFTARLSVCGLFAAVYARVSETQKTELRKLYNNLAADETPMVRRSAAHHLAEFVKVVDKQNCVADMIPVYRNLAADDTQDVIRTSCIETSANLVQLQFKGDPEGSKQHILPIITAALEDRSWRVRLKVAERFAVLCEGLGQDAMTQFLLAPFSNMLKDIEQEVRTAATKAIGDLLEADLLTQDQIQSYVVNYFQILALDNSQHVRAAVAKIIGPTGKKLGRDMTQKLLLNFVSDLIKDECHDVRLHMVIFATDVCTLLGPQDAAAHSLLNGINGVIMDKHWRIRRTVVEMLPALAKNFGLENFQRIESIFMKALKDSVHAVRMAAVDQCAHFCKHFGNEWATGTFIPTLLNEFSQKSGHCIRLTVLQTVVPLGEVLSAAQTESMLGPLLIKALNDVVPNVKYRACKLAPSFCKDTTVTLDYVTKEVRPVLEKLTSEAHLEVQQAAFLAKDAVDELIKNGKPS
ncbi:unnamed protein product [Amoebophrya sp. A120]|nr:unnamed protein product [Amoebophrya sp. A120]|eukprot:GSA120T00000471001.1